MSTLQLSLITQTRKKLEDFKDPGRSNVFGVPYRAALSDVCDYLGRLTAKLVRSEMGARVMPDGSPMVIVIPGDDNDLRSMLQSTRVLCDMWHNLFYNIVPTGRVYSPLDYGATMFPPWCSIVSFYHNPVSRDMWALALSPDNSVSILLPILLLADISGVPVEGQTAADIKEQQKS